MMLWPDDKEGEAVGGGRRYYMATGHRYVIIDSLLTSQPDFIQRHRCEITRYILERPTDEQIVLSAATFPQIVARAPIPMQEKLNRLMTILLGRLNHKPGRTQLKTGVYDTELCDLLRRTGIDIGTELPSILDALQAFGYIAFSATLDGTINLEVTASGILLYESEQSRTVSRTAFVAMWFAPELSKIYDDAIAPAIEANGYTAVRIDREQHNGKIDDEIIAAIRSSAFLIADFSCGEDGARGGVYYEAGFAAGLGKQVIFSVREQDLARVHFDTRQFNHVVWKEGADLKEALQNRIGATIGQAQ